MNRKEAGTNIRTHSGEHTHIYEKGCTNTKHAWCTNLETQGQTKGADQRGVNEDEGD